MNIRIISVGVIAIVAVVAITTGLYIATDGFADKAVVSLAPVPAPTVDTSSETSQEQVTKTEETFAETAVEPKVERIVDLEDESVATEEAVIPTLSNTKTVTSVLPQAKEATAVLANGCFWCVEHDLEFLPGVINVVSGYTGGTSKTPTYKNHEADGHREAVLVTYNPQLISYANLVEHIIKHGDPTDAEGSFFDRGPQYAPAIYYNSAEELEVARAVIQAVDKVGVFDKPIPLPILERRTFYPAEDYHQDYAKNNTLKYSHYRKASGRTEYIDRVWGSERITFSVSNTLNQEKTVEQINISMNTLNMNSWNNFIKPDEATLRATLSASAYKVTQEDGTERAGTSPLDKNYEQGIYVDVVSGEPLFSSRDKYDSGTGWPSFVKPISDSVVVLLEDKKLFSTRTEVRSRFADSHLGHVFTDGPADRGGMRYCMNGVALRFISEIEMEKEGYNAWLPML